MTLLMIATLGFFRNFRRVNTDMIFNISIMLMTMEMDKGIKLEYRQVYRKNYVYWFRHISNSIFSGKCNDIRAIIQLKKK